MSNESKLAGACLCGKVKITVDSPPASLGACHCSMCRNWGGGPLFAFDCGSGVSFDGAEYVSRFDSSAWAERGFCTNCGTHLFYRLKQQDQYMMLPGLFKDLGEMRFGSQVFIDEKPDFYEFSNETRKMTGAEVFAQFAPPE